MQAASAAKGRCKPMDRVQVSSTNLRSVGYDATAMLLEIEFLNGAIYEYSAVPLTVYEGLMAADSKGSFFHENVRSSYRYRQLR